MGGEIPAFFPAETETFTGKTAVALWLDRRWSSGRTQLVRIDLREPRVEGASHPPTTEGWEEEILPSSHMTNTWIGYKSNKNLCVHMRMLSAAGPTSPVWGRTMSASLTSSVPCYHGPLIMEIWGKIHGNNHYTSTGTSSNLLCVCNA